MLKSDLANNKIYDVVIIGGGPAGLNAALVLGRSRRKVLLFDHNRPRNASSKAIMGYLTRDGIQPNEFLKIGYEEIQKYDIQKIDSEIISVTKSSTHFEVTSFDGEKYFSKKILIATGIKDNIPDLPGLKQMYGTSIFHCPYCDGWEVRDKKIAVFAKGRAAHDLSLSLKTWSSNVVLITNGFTGLRLEEKETLKSFGIQIHTKKIKELEGKHGFLQRIIFTDNTYLEADAMFFSFGQTQHSSFAEQLGCRVSKRGAVLFDRKQKTNIRGVYVAGDAAMDLKFVIVAAAEGAKAAVAINIELQQEEILDHLSLVDGH